MRHNNCPNHAGNRCLCKVSDEETIRLQKREFYEAREGMFLHSLYVVPLALLLLVGMFAYCLVTNTPEKPLWYLAVAAVAILYIVFAGVERAREYKRETDATTIRELRCGLRQLQRERDRQL